MVDMARIAIFDKISMSGGYDYDERIEKMRTKAVRWINLILK